MPKLWAALLLVTAASAQTAEPFEMGPGIIPPVLSEKDRASPDYSAEGRLVHAQGTTVLNVVVGADGVPQDFQVTRSIGLGMDEEAIKAIKSWRFRPGEKAGKPVAVVSHIEVHFGMPDHDMWYVGRLIFRGDPAERPILKEATPPDEPVVFHNMSFIARLKVDSLGNVVEVNPEGDADPKIAVPLFLALRNWKFSPPAHPDPRGYEAELELIHREDK